MQSSDEPMFTRALATTFDVYGRSLPMADTIKLWIMHMRPYELKDVCAALSRFTATPATFPPTPGQILDLLGTGSDKRPGADEAWAIALTSIDERDTVVWTAETAEAFAICRPVLDLGDEVGARVAFKDAYNRLVASARHASRAPEWQVSLGFDAQRREQALRKAETAGLLPAPRVAALLPPAASDPAPTDAPEARANLAKIKQMLADAMPKPYEGLPFDAIRTQELKDAAEKRVQEYQNDGR